MKQEYMEAFTEVYEIFNLMPKELLNKIPIQFYELIKQNRSMEYKPNIQEPLEKCKLKNETIILLGLIYRDFLCSSQERKILQEKDEEELKKIQKEIELEAREKYSIDNIFEKKNETIQQENTKNYEENQIAIIQEKKWYEKIFYIIKNLFKKNK